MLLPYNFSQKHLCICIFKCVSNGVTDGHQTMDRPSNPNLLHSQMGYIMHLQACVHMLNIKNTKYMEITVKCCCLTTFHKNIFVYAFTSMCPMV